MAADDIHTAGLAPARPMSGRDVLPRRTYITLDGMRGIAAISVMLYHFSGFLTSSGTVLPKAYLAVDLFFILSGFVIAHAYETRRLSGRMNFGSYALARLIRLYPMYIASSAIGMGYFAIRLIIDPAQGSGLDAISILLSILFLPELAGGTLYRYNPAAWSLFFELVANFVYGAILPRLTNQILWVVVAVSAAFLIPYGLDYGSLDVGMFTSTLPGGLLRVFFSFSLGVLIWRHRFRVASSVHWMAYALPLALFGIFSVRFGGVYYDLFCVLLLFPIIIWIGSAVEPAADWVTPFRISADLSYPVYVLHTPMLLVIAGALKVAFRSDPWQIAPMSGLLMAATTLVLGWFMLRLFDEPVRRYLQARIGRKDRRANALVS